MPLTGGIKVLMTGTVEEKIQKPKRRHKDPLVPFKYYIHDTSDGVSLQMFGSLTDASVAELTSCWSTAKSTLKDRALTLDLRGLTLVDDSARRWIASMSQEGARYLPESFLIHPLAEREDRETLETSAPNIFGRLANALRGCS